jgi:hypothetical protein
MALFGKIILQWDEHRSYFISHQLLQTAFGNNITLITLPSHYKHTSVYLGNFLLASKILFGTKSNFFIFFSNMAGLNSFAWSKVASGVVSVQYMILSNSVLILHTASLCLHMCFHCLIPTKLYVKE